MTIQISLRDITLSHSSVPLVEQANLYIETGERVTLIGRNGTGKSTLLKLILGEIQPDHGTIERAKSVRIALLPQAVPSSMPGKVNDIVGAGLEVSNEDYWSNKTVTAKIISQLQLNGEAYFSDLSGGMKRLVLLASILVQEPDILLLDEPTNHLDIDKISQLENLLLGYKKTIVFVTHDRTLLQKLATHIVEIDNGKLNSWHGHYEEYLRYKESLLESETKANALFDKRLAQEEQWIRQGIKARRTRNEGRVRMLKKMREERQQRRVRQGQANFTLNKGELSGKSVFEVKNVFFNFGDKCIIKNFSTLIQRGDKIGIIGPNGAGKSTLINLLLGKLVPTEGEIRHGTKLTIGYFDQHRLQLDPERSIFDALSDLGDTITIGTHKKHIMSYLQDFLFSPTQARVPIKNLSGGERNRVMLAKIFSRPCNVLVLDEPTNDLDIETLELLEEILLEYSGTLLLISHDRTFINNIVTSTLVFEQNGVLEEYVGGYDDWLRQRQIPKPDTEKDFINKPKTAPAKTLGKLTFKEKKELTELPNRIDQLEQKQQEINQRLADPNFYKDEPTLALTLSRELTNIDKELAEYYTRWQELETKFQN